MGAGYTTLYISFALKPRTNTMLTSLRAAHQGSPILRAHCAERSDHGCQLGLYSPKP